MLLANAIDSLHHLAQPCACFAAITEIQKHVAAIPHEDGSHHIVLNIVDVCFQVGGCKSPYSSLNLHRRNPFVVIGSSPLSVGRFAVLFGRPAQLSQVGRSGSAFTATSPPGRHPPPKGSRADSEELASCERFAGR